MKLILSFLLFILITTISYSQSENDKIVYLDSTHMVTTSNEYKFYRIIKDYKLDKSSYAIREYYKSGVLQMESISKTKDGYSKEGEITYYYENGKKKSTTNYVKGRVNGKDAEWYDNGNKKLEGEYIADEKKRTAQHKINQFWDINGVKKITDGNGYFEDQGENASSKGEIKNGFKEGFWEGAFKKNNSSYKENYLDGKLISGISTDKNGTNYSYTEVEIAPNPKNGITDFLKYFAKNYRAPEKQGLKGKVYLTFVVDKEGKIVEPRVLRDIGYGTGEEAIRVVTAYDGFAPGEQRGQKVRCTYSLPISIQSAR